MEVDEKYIDCLAKQYFTKGDLSAEWEPAYLLHIEGSTIVVAFKSDGSIQALPFKNVRLD